MRADNEMYPAVGPFRTHRLAEDRPHEPYVDESGAPDDLPAHAAGGAWLALIEVATGAARVLLPPAPGQIMAGALGAGRGDGLPRHRPGAEFVGDSAKEEAE